MTTALAQFGGRDEVKELADRIKKMLPGGTNYTQQEALTLAQISVAHDLDPFNGECWLIKDSKSGKVYGALVGIKGHRKHAKRQANYWGWGNNGGFERITDPAILEDYGAVPGDIVHTYKIMDDVTSEGWTKSIRGFIDVGIPLEQAQKMAGQPPITLGIGIWKQGEKTKMKPVQCSMYRAEKDCLKRRFDVLLKVDAGNIPLALSNGEVEGDEVEADYIEYDEEPRDEDEIMAELGFGPNGKTDKAEVNERYEVEAEPSNGREWPEDYLAAIIDIGFAEALPHAANVLNMSQELNPEKHNLETCMRWVKGYRTRRENDIDASTAAIDTDAAFLAYQKNGNE